MSRVLVFLCLLGPSSLAQDAPLRVGMDTRSPPWVFVPGQDFSEEDVTLRPKVSSEQLARVEGLDVDVMRAIAKRVGRPVEIVLDAVIFDSTFVRWWAKTHQGYRVVGEPLNKLGYHVGVRKTDRELFEAADAAVQDWLDSPEAPETRQRWEGTD